MRQLFFVGAAEYFETPATRWLARGPRPLPSAFLKAGGFAPRPEVPFPWLPPTARVLVAPAAKLNAAGPELAVVEDAVTGGKRRLRLRLTSPRGRSPPNSTETFTRLRRFGEPFAGHARLARDILLGQVECEPTLAD